MKLYAATVSTKIQNFQHRLTHKIMGTNSKLYKWGMRLYNKCDFCKHKKENYIHLFYKCEKKIKSSGKKLRDGYKGDWYKCIEKYIAVKKKKNTSLQSKMVITNEEVGPT